MRLNLHLGSPSVLATAVRLAACAVALWVATPIWAGERDAPAPGSPAPDAAAIRARYDRIHDNLEAGGHRCTVSDVDHSAALAALRAFARDAVFHELEPGQPVRITLPDDYFNPQGRTVAFDSVDFAVNRMNLESPYISMTRTATGLQLESKFVVPISSTLTICSRFLSVEIPNGYRTDLSVKAPPPHLEH